MTNLPGKIIEDILRYGHSEWFSGHFGVDKTYRRILEQFWWPNL